LIALEDATHPHTATALGVPEDVGALQQLSSV
jgi:hypothetical protein